MDVVKKQGEETEKKKEFLFWFAYTVLKKKQTCNIYKLELCVLYFVTPTTILFCHISVILILT